MAVYRNEIPARYHGLRPIGRGAFGLVIQAEVEKDSIPPAHVYFPRLTCNKVAIKRIPADVAFRDSYHAKQVYREICLLKQLYHENIVKLVDLFFSAEGNIFIVTEAMQRDLASVIHQRAFTETEARFVSLQIIAGMRYLHASEILHRDLKPQNILVNPHLDLRICDLGLARQGVSESHNTGYVTTRWYRAPEVMFTWQHYAMSLDMWSVGCIIAELVLRAMGKVTFVDEAKGVRVPYYALFPASSHMDHLNRILRTLGPPPQHVVDAITEPSIKTCVMQNLAGLPPNASIFRVFPSLPPALTHLLSRLLDYDPATRITALDAMRHEYFRGEAQGLELTRAHVALPFEGLDLPPAAWRQIIENEITVLPPVEPPPQPEGAAAQPLDLLDVQDVLLLPEVKLTDISLASMAADQLALQQRMHDGSLPQQELLNLHQAVGELQSRLELYREAEPAAAMEGDLPHLTPSTVAALMGGPPPPQ